MAGRRCSPEAGRGGWVCVGVGVCVKSGYPRLGVFAQALCACWRTGGMYPAPCGVCHSLEQGPTRVGMLQLIFILII